MNQDHASRQDHFGSHDEASEHGAVGTVLHALASATAADGLEQRVLQRITTESRRPHRLSFAVLLFRRAGGWAMCGALAVCTVCAVFVPVLLHQRRAQQAASSETLSRPQHVAIGSAVTSQRAVDAQQHTAPVETAGINEAVAAPLRFLTQGLQHTHQQEAERNVATVRPASALGSPSFPAPEMPLTEQERLLIEIAHRNDPVQVAMLDPVARNREQQRERSATEKFFTPPPLPPELQSQINAALRSQYVNTPPPAALTSTVN